MRKFLALLVLLPLCLPILGCGGGPDPQSDPDFVDTSDPDVAADMLDADRPQPEGQSGSR